MRAYYLQSSRNEKDKKKKQNVTLRGGTLKTQGFKCDLIVYEEPERED